MTALPTLATGHAAAADMPTDPACGPGRSQPAQRGGGTQCLGRTPTARELAVHLCSTEADVRNALNLRSLPAATPARERQILVPRYVADVSQPEIAAQVGVSQMHVSRLLARTLTSTCAA